MNIGQLVADLKVDVGDIKKAQREMMAFQKKSTSSMNSVNSTVGKAGNTLKKFGKIVGTAFAFQQVVKFGKEVVNAASDAEEIANKYEVVFSGISKEAQKTAKDLAKNYGLGTSAAKELLSSTGDLLTGLGATQETALDLSNSTQQLAVDLASFTNIEGGAKRASEALTKAMLGEREMLKTYGIVIRGTALKERLRQKGLDKLTGTALLQAKAEETLAMAMEQSKNALGDYNRTQDSFANQRRLMNARWKQLKILIGKELLPIVGKWIKKITELAKWVIENFDAVKKWAKIIGTAAAAITTMRIAMKILNATMAANPIGLVVMAVTTLISVIITAYRESETFRAKVKYAAAMAAFYFKQAWVRIEAGAKTMWDAIKFYFGTIAEAGKALWQSIQAIFEKGAKPGEIWKSFAEGTVGRFQGIGKEAAEEMRQKIEAARPPSYEQMLAAEKAKEAGEKAGKAASEGFASGMGSSGGGGSLTGGRDNPTGGGGRGSSKLQAELAQIANMNATLGDSYDAVGAKISLYQNKIQSLIKDGYEPNSKAVIEYSNKLLALKQSQQQLQDIELPDDEIWQTALQGTQQLQTNTNTFFQSLQQKYAQLRQTSSVSWQQIAQHVGTAGSSITNTLGAMTDYYRVQKQNEIAIAEQTAKSKGKSEKWLAKRKEKISKEYAKKQKAIAIATALINVAQGVTKAIAQGGILGIITGALVAAAGAIQIAKIKSEKFATGGTVPAGYPGDSYPAMLSSGETVIPKSKKPLQNVGAGGGQLTTRVRGRDLEIVLNRWKMDKELIS